MASSRQVWPYPLEDSSRYSKAILETLDQYAMVHGVKRRCKIQEDEDHLFMCIQRTKTLVVDMEKGWLCGLEIKFVENYFFLENYVNFREPFLTILLYYQQLSITCYQVRFYDNNYFE